MVSGPCPTSHMLVRTTAETTWNHIYNHISIHTTIHSIRTNTSALTSTPTSTTNIYIHNSTHINTHINTHRVPPSRHEEHARPVLEVPALHVEVAGRVAEHVLLRAVEAETRNRDALYSLEELQRRYRLK